MKSIVSAALGSFFVLAISINAFSVGSAGLGNEVAGARSLGQGGTGMAQAFGPESLYLNPAVITDLPSLQATYGITYEDTHSKHTTNAGTEEKMRPIGVAVPNFSMTSSGWWDDKLTFGLTTQSPYGSETHWSDSGFSRFISTNARLHMLVVNPAVAMKANKDISLGVGLDYIRVVTVDTEHMVSGAVLEQALIQATGLSGNPAAAQDFLARQKAEGHNFSWNAGWYYHPEAFPKHSLGFSYRPKVKLPLYGGTELTGITGPLSQAVFGSTYKTSSETEIFLPQTISLGYAFRVNDRLSTEFDWGWSDWAGAMKDTNIRYSDPNIGHQSVLTTGNPVKRDWRSTNNFAVGANYKVSEPFSVRAGYYYIPWVSPESTFSPSIVDLTRHALTVGGGYQFGKITLDLAYNAIFMKSRTINNTIADYSVGTPGVANVSGEYSSFINLVSLNVSAKF